ncbi:aldehyde dehydrogenase family protein [Nocardia gamkensis]|uniref:aldehyde dehydrogenase family protein n=1 Tax=Nocardia gamkensis TaxID=352869 RepID=UPI0036EECFE1
MTTVQPASQMAREFAPESRLYIAGTLRTATDGRTVDNINPATEEILGVAADAGPVDMDAAIGAARHAFDNTNWASDHSFREHCLLQLHSALQEEVEQLRAELIAETGCPVSSTYGPQLDWPITEAIRWPAGYINSFPWERELPDGALLGSPYRRRVLKEPVGVVGAISAWNFPFEIASNKIGQVLATGNTMVLKPAIETPWSVLRLGRIIAEKTDIPPGVVNIVPTASNELAQTLVTDARIDMVSFTGSSAVGQRIQSLSAATMKRTLLELGGKSAYILLEDADLETALPGCLGAFVHAGQGCGLTTRVLVPASLYEQAVEAITELCSSATVGDPTDPATLCGPVVSKRQHDRVLEYIRIGSAEGGRLTVGGGVPEHMNAGYFVEPTVFADVEPHHRLFKEEIFGPVLTITSYDGGDDAAVALANTSDYGLAGAVFGSADRALEVARKVRTGTMNVNGAVFYGADAPFGGYKMSGLGRQNGHEGFEQYLQTKTIAFP